MDIDIEGYAKDILKLLISSMKIKSYDLCLCGSGKKYKKCCNNKDGESIIFTRNSFETLSNYKKSQSIVKHIPLGILNKFFENSLNRFGCLYPNCKNQTVSCHLIPENILRRNFGTHCLESKIQDYYSNPVYIKTGVNEAGTLPVFCSEHDNNLFKKIDTLNIDSGNLELQFLMALKSISFLLRRVQYLIGVDYQIEIFRPFIILQNEGVTPKNGNIELKISEQLSENYLRLKILTDIFKDAIKMLEQKKWENFSYFYRSIKSDNIIYFSSYINPIFDLNGARINDLKTPINMAINVFSKDGATYILLSCPPQSKNYYHSLFKQLKEATESQFRNYFNNLIKISSNKPLLPLHSNFENELF